MRHLLMRHVFLVFAFLTGLALPAWADDIAAGRDTIKKQEQAFARDDSAAAYSYAAPSIQGAYPQADTFMSMVRNAFAPVYRHRSFEFGETRTKGAVIEQDVQIVDGNGVVWEALYTLEPQPDGSVKISGCSLKQVGQSA